MGTGLRATVLAAAISMTGAFAVQAADPIKGFVPATPQPAAEQLQPGLAVTY